MDSSAKKLDSPAVTLSSSTAQPRKHLVPLQLVGARGRSKGASKAAGGEGGKTEAAKGSVADGAVSSMSSGRDSPGKAGEKDKRNTSYARERKTAIGQASAELLNLHLDSGDEGTASPLTGSWLKALAASGGGDATTVQEREVTIKQEYLENFAAPSVGGSGPEHLVDLSLMMPEVLYDDVEMIVDVSAEDSPGSASAADPGEIMEKDRDDVPSEAASGFHGDRSPDDEDDMSDEDIPDGDGSSRSGSSESTAKTVARVRIKEEVAAGRLEQRKRSLEHALDDSEGDETPVEEEDELKAITFRKMEGGKAWYKCYWKFQKGYQYLPETGLRNAGDLKAVCDEYMKALNKDPLLKYWDYRNSTFTGLRAGSNIHCTCVYEAAQVLMNIQGNFKLTSGMVVAFQGKYGVDPRVSKGLTNAEIELFFNYLISQGWKMRLNKSKYNGELNGPQGLASALEEVDSLYLASTMDSPGLAHCFVISVEGGGRRVYVHEGGQKFPLGAYKYAQTIRFVRRCDHVQVGAGIEEDQGNSERVSIVSTTLAPRKKLRSKRKHRSQSNARKAKEKASKKASKVEKKKRGSKKRAKASAVTMAA